MKAWFKKFMHKNNKFKPGDTVIKTDGRIGIVKLVPGMPQYDAMNLSDSDEGFTTEGGNWWRFKDCVLNTTPAVPTPTLAEFKKMMVSGSSVVSMPPPNKMKPKFKNNDEVIGNSGASIYHVTKKGYKGKVFYDTNGNFYVDGHEVEESRFDLFTAADPTKVVKKIKKGVKYKLAEVYHLVKVGMDIETNIDNGGEWDSVLKGKITNIRNGNQLTANLTDSDDGDNYNSWDMHITSNGWISFTGQIKNKPKKLQVKYLDSLVIDPGVKNEIISTLKQAENHDKIFNKWGLGKVIEYGRGMTFMFWGKPGTGKTYGANLIAKALGAELLILSAGDIQSSEPGAANRNIDQAFKTAKEKNMVLFIDECDSLIFNREQLGMVLASEVNTLLTAIEKFEGVCILATNRISDMDAALERRISLIVEFPMPNKEQRHQIWKNLLPPKLPIAELDINKLAEYEISGGIIKNAVLAAARMAAAEKATIVTEAHFETAIKRVISSQNLMGTRKGQTARMDTTTGIGTGKKVEKIVDIFDSFNKKKA